MRIAIIFGGSTVKYKESLVSACALIKNIDTQKHQLVLIGVSPTGDWFHYQGKLSKIEEDTWCNSVNCKPMTVSLEHRGQNILVMEDGGIRKIRVDVVFPVLYNKAREDGSIQGMFALAGIPVVGSGILSSSLSKDKYRAHALANAAGVIVPHSFVFEKDMDMEIAMVQAEQLGYPLFVKPLRSSTSMGNTKVIERDNLVSAIKMALCWDEKIIIEECILGMDVGCSILGKGHELVAGEVEEKLAHTYVPIRVSEAIAEKIQFTAKTVYKALGCRGFARVDFFFSHAEEIVFHKLSTTPGFMEKDPFFQMLKGIGLSPKEAVEMILEI